MRIGGFVPRNVRSRPKPEPSTPANDAKPAAAGGGAAASVTRYEPSAFFVMLRRWQSKAMRSAGIVNGLSATTSGSGRFFFFITSISARSK